MAARRKSSKTPAAPPEVYSHPEVLEIGCNEGKHARVLGVNKLEVAK